jgi:chromosome segregation ATPase
VLRLFAPLTKPLKLLKKQDETGRHTLTPEERTAIGSILSSPLQALGEDINGSLRAIQKVIGSDPAVLKDRKRETALNWIEQLLQADLASITEKRERLQLQITETTSTLSDSTVLQAKEELEQSLESAQGQLVHLREELARSKKHIVSLDEELREKKQRLVKALEELAGNEIAVTFDF